ncbi:hypothetical protein AVEN_248817-1 [Araneus ventricosus]|uniref:Uncharacterized protein n=1 Tax=Araneus ventricosus TaxID=182803 RepID=A0A4Y2J7A8_ARAVE|nr:hypothetical protein AVEN_248817-1 [Araneus ventricosus]
MALPSRVTSENQAAENRKRRRGGWRRVNDVSLSLTKTKDDDVPSKSLFNDDLLQLYISLSFSEQGTTHDAGCDAHVLHRYLVPGRIWWELQTTHFRVGIALVDVAVLCPCNVGLPFSTRQNIYGG